MYIIETKQLSKNFRNIKALKSVDLQLKPGKIYGLVGNNGAGKTTLFRLLAGLARPTEGSFSLFGETSTRGLNQARKHCGFLIESAVYYPSMTAQSNLRNVQLLLGRGNKADIARTLEQVGLNPKSRQLMTSYSMGMKQRYGLAAALIGDPELLILDEPLNGLDPRGAREINQLLKDLCAQGKTILLSSHLLGELYKTATDYIFMDHGRIIKQLSHKELENLCGFEIVIRTADLPNAEAVLHREIPDVELVMEPGCIRLLHSTATAGEIQRMLYTEGMEVRIETSGITLEDYFLALVEGSK